MHPISFDYKPELLVKSHQVGFLAEEMCKIVPEVVGLKDGQPDNIDYGKLTPILVRAIQELYAKFTELSDKILAILDRLNGHDEKIADLEARVAQLEALVNGGVNSGGGGTSPIPEPTPEPTPAPEPEPEVISELPIPSTESSILDLSAPPSGGQIGTTPEPVPEPVSAPASEPALVPVVEPASELAPTP